MKKVSFLFGLLFLLTVGSIASLSNFASDTFANQQEPIAIVNIENISDNFPSVEVLKIDVTVLSEAAMEYGFILGQTGSNSRRGESDEFLIVTEVSSDEINEPGNTLDIVSAVHASNSGGPIMSGSIGSIRKSSAHVVEPLIEGVPESGTYTLSQAGERISLGSVLGQERYIELIGEGFADFRERYSPSNQNSQP